MSSLSGVRGETLAANAFSAYSDTETIGSVLFFSGVGSAREGCPLPSRLEGLGKRRELPQWGPGDTPAANAFSAYSRPPNASRRKKEIFIFSQLQQYELLIQQIVSVQS